MIPKKGFPHRADKELIRRIHEGGDEADAAVSALYLKYRGRMILYLNDLVGPHPEYRSFLQDILHDSFLLMLHKIEISYVHSGSLLSFWKGISRNVLQNRLKRDNKIILVDEPDESYYIGYDTPESRIFDQEEHEEFEHSFDCLGDRCKEVLLLWINRFTMDEIAARMGLSSPAMARKIKHECFKKLKNLVLNGNKSTSRDT